MAGTTRYAQSGDVSIAYQVVGDGPLDVVFVPGFVSHVELGWEMPWFGACWRRIARYARLIVFDKRGTGLSDRIARVPTLEERMDDVRAVMDAAGCERAAFMGVSEGGPMSLLFAATHPERTAALVLYGSFARCAWAPDHPIGYRPEEIERAYAFIARRWGTGRVFSRIAYGGLPDDDATLALVGRVERYAATPAASVANLRFGTQTDIRHVLASITTPTLVVHRTGDPFLRIEHARYLAEHIPNARLVELPGDVHLGPLHDADDRHNGFDEIEEFLTGTRPAAPVDRVLATVLFTDIVGSTERAAALGDRRWRATLDRHDAAVRRELARARGREIKTTGDGFVAAFDGPARAIRCAHAIVAAARELALDVRAGLHSGECEVRGEDLSGLAVHIGARVAALAGPGDVLVTSTVRDLVLGAGIEFDARGDHALRGVPGTWSIFAAKS